MAVLTQQVRDELSRIEEDILYTEKAHFAASDAFGRIHLWLGLAATGASAVGATTIVGDAPDLHSGVLALVAAKAAAVLTFMKPEERARQHLQVGRSLASLRVQIRQTKAIDLAAAEPPATDWRGFVAGLSAEKAEIVEVAPAVSNRVLARTRRRIECGDFIHDREAVPVGA